MKIAVNTRLLIADKLSGIGWFSYHTLKRIVTRNPQHQFIFLFDRKFDDQFIFGKNVIPEVIFPPTRHAVLQYYWFNHAIIPILKKYQPDLFYSPDGFSSLRLGNIPSLLVMHDINFHHYPRHIPFFDSIYLNRYFPRFARSATRLLTVSEYSKSDIIKTYNVSPDKIDVTCNGSNEIFLPLNDNEKKKVKSEHTGGSDYFIYIGDLLPRKNIARLLKAYETYKNSTGSKTKLVLIGKKMCLTSEMESVYKQLKHKDDIIFLGKLAPEKLRDLLGAALSLVFVSYFEGFGIPIIEAMNAGIPVITSNVTSMPEIAGDAALLVDPFSIESIANAMTSVEKDPQLRQQLIGKGRIRKEMYTWDKSADAIWKSIEKTLSESKRT
jgi:glycosyltransferase involved in cell wall biosynthesis